MSFYTFKIFLFFHNKSLVELLLDIIVQLSKTNIVKQKILNTSEYFRSIWLFLKSVNSDEGKNAEFFKKTIDILKLLQSVDTAKFNYVLQKDDYKYMKEIVEKYNIVLFFLFFSNQRIKLNFKNY